jgi:hypothetical protein
VLCGSNNLTRSGCSSNLELLNSLPFDLEGKFTEDRNVAREAFAFFEQAARNADQEISRIAVEWLEETADTYSWLKEPVDSHGERTTQLIHTYDGSIWDRLIPHLERDKPREFFIASPFHDADGEVCRRLAKQWPQAKFEFLVQQGYTNLAVHALRELRTVRLAELVNASRRIHAKLIAWQSSSRGGCMVGSANFTSAAFDGRNVEACLLLTDASELVDALFDRSLTKRPLALEDFEPGDEQAPESDMVLPALRINSALLTDENRLRISYSQQLETTPSSLRVAIRSPGETRPRASMILPIESRKAESVLLPDSALAEAHGTLLATLVAAVEGSKVQSPPVWVIQENHLTYEPGEGAASSKGKIEDTGEGLPEYLDELGAQSGLAAVVDYLRHLNIRFQDGGGRGLGPRKFRLRVRDPFRSDIAPAWLIKAKMISENLERAIYEFVDRHDKRRLRKHTSRGNINGIENFVDILTSLVRLLYVYYKRGVVEKEKLIERLRTFIELATVGRRPELIDGPVALAFGKDARRDAFKGYLNSVFTNLDGDVEMLREACSETNYLAEVRAILLIAQSIRFEPKKDVWSPAQPTRPRDVLPYYSKAISTAISDCHLNEPKPKDIQRALEDYRMFSELEIAALVAEILQ